AEVVVLFAPPDGQGWRDALYAALDGPPATVVSVSWGNAEFCFSEAHVRGIEDALAAASLRQVTVCCASGDFGSRATSGSAAANGLANVAFPASSPLVLACGGSALRHNGTGIAAESAWNAPGPGGRFATGGGVSGRFPLPDFQGRAKVPKPGRTARL